MLRNVLKWETQGHQYGLTKHVGVRKSAVLAQEQPKHRSGEEFPEAWSGFTPTGRRFQTQPPHGELQQSELRVLSSIHCLQGSPWEQQHRQQCQRQKKTGSHRGCGVRSQLRWTHPVLWAQTIPTSNQTSTTWQNNFGQNLLFPHYKPVGWERWNRLWNFPWKSNGTENKKRLKRKSNLPLIFFNFLLDWKNWKIFNSG